MKYKKVKKFKNIVCIFILIIIGMLCVFVGRTHSASRIDMGINALSNMVEADGSIRYKIDFLKNEEYKKNNIVREMGSAYALAFAYNQTKNKNLEKKLRLILSRIQNKYCQTFEEGTCYVANDKNKIKIGATALALLAVLYFEQTNHDSSFSDLKAQLANALANSYRENVGIISPTTTKISPYYDGETWFALSVYNIFYPSDKKIEDLLRSLDDTMFKNYKDKYLISFIHWGTMAGSYRFQATKDDKFIDFLKTQFDLYLKNNPIPRKRSSTCSLMEGFSDIVYVISDTDIAFAQKVFNRIEESNEQIYDLQVIHDEVIGSQSKEFPYIHDKTKKYIGAFKHTPHHYLTRNDATQHCLIALLKRERALKKIHP